MIIYKITNLINGKIYIGQTIKTMKIRWKSHLSDLKLNVYYYHLYNAMRKYGIDNFKIEEIDTAKNQEELDEKEIYWIDFYDSLNPKKGYNCREGGSHGKHREETKKKMSISRKKYLSNPENKEKMVRSVKEALNRPEIKKRHIEGIKNSWTPERRREHSEIMKKVLNDLTIKKRISDGVKNYYKENPGKALEKTKKSWETKRKKCDV